MVNVLMAKCPYFKGTFARDELPVLRSLPAGLIVNSDVSSSPGTHWLAIWIDGDGKGILFDSFALPAIFPEINAFMDKYAPDGWAISMHALQSNDSDVCGYYAILFIYIISNDIEFCEFIKLFTNNKTFNDLLVKSIVLPLRQSI